MVLKILQTLKNMATSALFRECGYKVLVWCFVKECLNEIPIKLMIVLYGFPYLIQRPYFSWPNNQEHI